ncbi:MAG: hypothetical protein AB6733_06710 [Clostridiaceae bacterium]
MFICVKQAKAVEKNKDIYEISVDGVLKYFGETPKRPSIRIIEINDMKKIKLMNIDGEIIYNASCGINEDLLKTNRPFIDKYKVKEIFLQMDILDKSNKYYGSICGMKSDIDSTLCFIFNNEEYLVYDMSKGKVEIISIYKDNLQIAQITKPIYASGNLDCYYIHLQNEYAYIMNIISIFGIYYDFVYHYGNENRKYDSGVTYTFSSNNKYYNRLWISEQFGQEEHNNFLKLLKEKHGATITDCTKKFIFGMIAFFIAVFSILAAFFYFISFKNYHGR